MVRTLTDLTGKIMTKEMILELLKGFDIARRSCDNYYDATIIIDAWNESNNYTDVKVLHDYLGQELTKEMVSHIEETYECTMVNDRPYSVIFDSIIIWIHPLLFPSFICWLHEDLREKMVELDML